MSPHPPLARKTHNFGGHIRSGEHGHARPEHKHTPAKASYASPLQATASHSAIWAAAFLLCSPSRASILVLCHFERPALFGGIRIPLLTNKQNKKEFFDRDLIL